MSLYPMLIKYLTKKPIRSDAHGKAANRCIKFNPQSLLNFL
jgi:hypothetical protein